METNYNREMISQQLIEYFNIGIKNILNIKCFEGRMDDETRISIDKILNSIGEKISFIRDDMVANGDENVFLDIEKDVLQTIIKEYEENLKALLNQLPLEGKTGRTFQTISDEIRCKNIELSYLRCKLAELSQDEKVENSLENEDSTDDLLSELEVLIMQELNFNSAMLELKSGNDIDVKKIETLEKFINEIESKQLKISKQLIELGAQEKIEALRKKIALETEKPQQTMEK